MTIPKLTIRLPRILLITNLRTLRRARMGMQMDLEFLQEEAVQRTGDVVNQGAILALASEIEMLTGIIHELRGALGAAEANGIPEKEE